MKVQKGPLNLGKVIQRPKNVGSLKGLRNMWKRSKLIKSRRGSETSLRGSFYSTQETSLTDLFFTLVRLVSETDFLPFQRLVSQRSKTGQRD